MELHINTTILELKKNSRMYKEVIIVYGNDTKDLFYNCDLNKHTDNMLEILSENYKNKTIIINLNQVKKIIHTYN